MRFVLYTVMFVITLGLCGCNAPPEKGVLLQEGVASDNLASNIVTKPIIHAFSGLIGEGIEIDRAVSRVNKDGFIELEVAGHNRSFDNRVFQYKVEWLDKDGMVIDTTTSKWLQTSAAGKSPFVIKAVAPRTSAVDFKMTMIKKLLPFVLAFAICGCQGPTENIDTINDQGKAVMQLDYRDFDRAASTMVQSLISSGALKKQDGGKYVVATGRIVNDTMQRVDTDQLMAKVEKDLMDNGLVVITSAVTGGTSTRDSMLNDVRDIRDSQQGDEFKKDTLQAKGQLIAPELTISGKIIQRNVRYDNGRQQVEYYFQLQLTNLTTGLRSWQNETILGKRGSDKTVPW
jgi:uncharacterized protein (TIGR02722 family)